MEMFASGRHERVTAGAIWRMVHGVAADACADDARDGERPSRGGGGGVIEGDRE